MALFEVAIVPKETKVRGLMLRDAGEPLMLKPAGSTWGNEALKHCQFVKLELTEEEAKALCAPLLGPAEIKLDEKAEPYTHYPQLLERARRIDLTKVSADAKLPSSKSCIYDAVTPASKEEVK